MSDSRRGFSSLNFISTLLIQPSEVHLEVLRISLWCNGRLMPQSVSGVASANSLFPVASRHLCMFSFCMNLAVILVSISDNPSSFHWSKLKFLTFLPRLLASEGDSMLIISGAVFKSLKKHAFWYWMNCSLLVNSVPLAENLQ